MPRPARSTGTITAFLPFMTGALKVVSGVSTGSYEIGKSRVSS